MAAVRRILLILLLASACFGRDAAKPACNADAAGRFYPEEANSSSAAARRLAQCGALEICTLSVWRYRWAPATVHVSQLGKRQGETAPACAAPAGEKAGAGRRH